MARQIPAGVIQMDKGAVDARHTLEHILQTLAQVVAVPEGHALVEDDVDFDVELVARVVGLAALDGFDGFGEAHGEVEEDVAVFVGGGGAGEVFDVGAGGAGPVDDDVEGEEEAAEGVEPPEGGVVADEREDDGEDVEDDVGHGVLGQGLHGAVLDEPAPEPAAEFDEHGGRHDDDRGEAELDDAVVGRREPVETFEEDLEEGGYHDDAEDEDAERFEASAADGVAV